MLPMPPRTSGAAPRSTERSNILMKIAQRMEDKLELLAKAETWDNGKPIRETMAADIPLAIDHFRYFASCIRAQEGSIGEIDHDTVAYHFHEPLGVVGQIIPWNFPILMAAWKLAPALAAGNCVVIKPAEQTPASLLVWAELVGDLCRPACSTSSTASASKPASRLPPARASPRSPSPAKPRPAG
jgi:aldehyde dehydrogenase